MPRGDGTGPLGMGANTGRGGGYCCAAWNLAGGPKAFRVLQAAGVAICTTEAATVAEALDLYREGKLSRALTANAQGHRP